MRAALCGPNCLIEFSLDKLDDECDELGADEIMDANEGGMSAVRAIGGVDCFILLNGFLKFLLWLLVVLLLLPPQPLFGDFELLNWADCARIEFIWKCPTEESDGGGGVGAPLVKLLVFLLLLLFDDDKMLSIEKLVDLDLDLDVSLWDVSSDWLLIGLDE